jgi:hypothetical protein
MFGFKNRYALLDYQQSLQRLEKSVWRNLPSFKIFFPSLDFFVTVMCTSIYMNLHDLDISLTGHVFKTTRNINNNNHTHVFSRYINKSLGFQTTFVCMHAIIYVVW